MLIDSDLIDIADEIKAALHQGRPVVALESTILAHGFPPGVNRELAKEMCLAVHNEGAVPAVIAIRRGALTVAADSEFLDDICTPGKYAKCNISDFGFYLDGRDAATTVSSTLAIAAGAGIYVVATGGIGGVHRENPADVSSDLTQLTDFPMLLVCSGAKSFLDQLATVERLETLGVGILGYGTDEWPMFYTRSSGVPLAHRVDTPEQAWNTAANQLQFGRSVLIANPVPAKDQVPPEHVAALVDSTQAEGTLGKDVTPAILKNFAEKPEFLAANRSLAVSNARLAAQIAHHALQ